MKKSSFFRISVLLLAICLWTGVAAAGNGNGGPSIENIPVVVVEPLPPMENGQPLFERTELPNAAGLREKSEGDSVFFDIMILRPAGLFACAAGLVASAIALPFSLPTGSQGKVVKTLIADPFAYTFARPVGCIEPATCMAPR